MERQLATVQKILKLSPIDGADRIECAQILGWECVVTKGEFKEGDLCVYFEIDSQLPIHIVFDFMANRHYRVKTAKFKKQISQGLAMPLSVLRVFMPNTPKGPYTELLFNEGLDVTKLIGVTKHDPRPENANPISIKHRNPVINFLFGYKLFRKAYSIVVPRKTSGNFPEFINKTDETRLQNYPRIITKNIGTKLYFTEKLDGSSATYFFNAKLSGKRLGLFNKDKGNGFGVCSRNLRLVHKDNSYWWKHAINSDMEENLKDMVSFLRFNLAIQGELVGPSIQENKYKLNNLQFYCYNLFNIDTQKYLDFEDKYMICDKFGIPCVPIVDKIVVHAEHEVPFFVELSKRKSVLNKDVLAEGIVGRRLDDDSVSFKVINPEWLLKYKE